MIGNYININIYIAISRPNLLHYYVPVRRLHLTLCEEGTPLQSILLREMVDMSPILTCSATSHWLVRKVVSPEVNWFQIEVSGTENTLSDICEAVLDVRGRA